MVYPVALVAADSGDAAVGFSSCSGAHLREARDCCRAVKDGERDEPVECGSPGQVQSACRGVACLDVKNAYCDDKTRQLAVQR